MTKEELNISISKLVEEFERKRTELICLYPQSNNPIKIGDIIEDHYHIIKVEKMEYCPSMGTCKFNILYIGTRLTKKGTPHIKGAYDNAMYLTNVRFINGKSYKFTLT